MSNRQTAGPAAVLRNSDLIVPLAEAHEHSLELVGGKAANLGHLIGAEFPVPDGFVLTTSAFQQIVQEHHFGADDGSGDIASASLPDSIINVLEQAVDGLGDGQLAVRSSGVAEDLADVSYAGQYETVLGVRGSQAVVDAVRHCWSSAFSTRVQTYQRSQGAQGVPPLAVLVQHLVPADVAGVAFTADPVSGDREVVVVNAVAGLGDRLVTGEAIPDEWVVRDDQTEPRGRPEQAITKAQVQEIARLARQVEHYFGTPQDIEWAIRDGQVHVLQARPITSLPQPPVVDIPPGGTWLKDTTHYPEPMTPFGASVFLPALEAGIQTMCAEYGMMVDRVEQLSIGGEIYGRPVTVGEKDGPPPPWWMLAILARVLPPFRARLKAARQAIRQDRIERLPEQWETRGRDQFRTEAEHLRAIGLDTLSDTGLLRHLDAAIDFLHRGQIVHFRLFIPYAVPLHELVVTCHEQLGWQTLETLELLSGLSSTSSEPARALFQLADQIRNRPAAREVVERPGGDIRSRLAEADPEIAATLDDYIARFGHRSINYDPGARTLAERPDVLATLLRDALREGPAADVEAELEEQRARAEARALETLAERPDADRKQFEEALARARRNYPLREDNIFWTDNVPSGVIRGILLEIGRRLHERGVLHDAEDAAYLEVDEVRTALRGNGDQDLTATVSRRRAEQAWVAAHPGPAFHGAPPTPPPDIRGLPVEARRTNGALMWLMGEEYTPRQPDTTDGLAGIPGSPGRYTGTVRVIQSESEFERLRPGEVLVCPSTTPTWSILFPNVGALVTDGGGTLSHAAVIAREYGIPAVLGTQLATRELRDGQVVTVDGTAGHVTVDDSDEPIPSADSTEKV